MGMRIVEYGIISHHSWQDMPDWPSIELALTENYRLMARIYRKRRFPGIPHRM
jgi:hypothetical protein